MRHSWDEGDMFMGTIVSECLACGGYRTRKRLANVDFINTGTISIDMVGKTNKGWTLDEGTPRSCPGKRIEVKRMSHRNGERELPVEDGRYWFDGKEDDKPYRGMVHAKAQWEEMDYWSDTMLGWNRISSSTYEGQWFGPIVPPWEAA